MVVKVLMSLAGGSRYTHSRCLTYNGSSKVQGKGQPPLSLPSLEANLAKPKSCLIWSNIFLAWATKQQLELVKICSNQEENHANIF